MRTPLIATFALVSLISLANTASSTDPKPVGDRSRASLLHTCNKLGGELHNEENFFSRCTLPGDGATIECDGGGYCQGWVPFTADHGKAGTGTTAGTPEGGEASDAPPRAAAVGGDSRTYRSLQ